MSRKKKRSLLFRRLTILGGLALGVVAVFAGIFWFQDADLRKAEQQIAEGNHEAAVRLIRAWERTYAASGRSQALLARSLAESGDVRLAIRIFETVGAANTVEIHAWARACLSAHQWSNALPLLKDLRIRDPENADILHELAACQAKLGLLEEALETANEFKSHEKYAHRAWLLIGVLHSQRGNKTAAIEAWQKIAQYDPEYLDLQLRPEEFLTQFASLQIELGQAAEASALLTKALSIRETAEAQFQAGLAADLIGDHASAKQRWQRTIELDSSHRNGRESLARLALASGNADEARILLAPLAGSQDLRSSTAYLMQRVAQLKGDAEQAETWKRRTEELRHRETIDSTVNRLLTEAPDSYWSQVVRCYQFAESGNFQQAQQLLDRIRDENEDPFVADLRVAVATQGKLPEKSRFPIKQF